jgi:hypothetical protein
MGLTIANALLARAELRAGVVSRPFRADIRRSFCLIHPRNRPFWPHWPNICALCSQRWGIAPNRGQKQL